MCREDLKKKNIDLTRIGENDQKQRGLEESCKSLIVSTLMEERKEEEMASTDAMYECDIISV